MNPDVSFDSLDPDVKSDLSDANVRRERDCVDLNIKRGCLGPSVACGCFGPDVRGNTNVNMLQTKHCYSIRRFLIVCMSHVGQSGKKCHRVPGHGLVHDLFVVF